MVVLGQRVAGTHAAATGRRARRGLPPAGTPTSYVADIHIAADGRTPDVMLGVSTYYRADGEAV